MATAGSIVVDLLMRTGSFETDTARAEKRLKQLQKQIDDTAKAIGSTIGAGVAVAVGVLATLTVQSINYADQLDELSNRLGISTEQLSAWGYAAKLTGTDLDALAGTIPRLSKNLAAALDEGSKQADLFKALGVEVTDAAGNLREVEDVLPEISDRFKQLTNDTTEAALAQELFGKSGAEFLEFLNLGSDGLAEMSSRAAELGAIIDGETAAAAGDFKDKLDELKAAAGGLGTQIAAQLLPVANELTDQLVDWAREGDLARNVTTLLTAAVNLGAGAIDAYNNAVDRTSIAIGVAAEAAAGYLQIQSQIATLGFAEGSASDGWKRITGAFSNGQRELDDLRARQNKPRGPIPGVDEIDFSRGAPVAPGEQSGLDRQLNRYLSGADGKSKAAKATKELTAAEKEWAAFQEEMAAIEDVWREASAESVKQIGEKDKALEDARKHIDDQIADMVFEKDILSLSNKERAKEIELRYAGAAATEEQRAQIAELAGATYDANVAIERQVDALDAVRGAAGGFLEDLKDGVGVFDALENAVDRLVDKLFDLAADGIIDQLLGQQGDTGTGSAGGWLSTFASMFGGARAGGGDVLGGRGYLVGEQGPELFVPRTAGMVLTADETASMGRGGGRGMSVTQVFNNAVMTDVRSESQRQQQAAQQLRIASARNG